MNRIKEIIKCYNENAIVRRVNVVLVYIFLFNVIFFPNDTFNIKIISLFLLLVLNFWSTPLKNKIDYLVFFFGLIVPTFTIVLSIIITKSFINNIKLGYPAVILLLYLVVKKFNINFEKVFFIMLEILAYIEVIVFILHISGVLRMRTNPMVLWYGKTNNALYGEGKYATFGSLFYIKSACLLFVYEAYCIEKRKYFSLVITCIALFATGTRANVFLMLALLYICCIIVQKNNKIRVCIILSSLVAIIVGLFGAGLYRYILAIFEKKSFDDAVRSGHLSSLIKYWKSDIVRFIIGSGYESEFYSIGVNAMVRDIELSYFNLLRQVGIIPFMAMMGMYALPIVYVAKNKIKSKKIVCITMGYIMYLILGAVDPFLYNSTAVTLVLYMYYICFDTHYIENLENKL